MADAKEKAEMLRKAKEAMAGKKPEANEHKVSGKSGENVIITQADLPTTPVLHLHSSDGCEFTLSDGLSLVKLLVEGCRECKVTIPSSAKITTSMIEVWRCDKVAVHTAIEIGTMQIDLCA
eukprot:m.87783 g.87783  ORF g.87783 m.87783 type:complete len:121 (+) comp9723_c0_seq3:125-487(+)